MIELFKNRIVNIQEIAYVEPKKYLEKVGYYIKIIFRNGKEIELFYEDDNRTYWLKDIDRLKGELLNDKL